MSLMTLNFHMNILMTESGEYQIVFNVLDALGGLYFNASVDISVG